MKTATLILMAATLAPASARLSAQAPRDYTKYNVCEVVPGDVIARAFGGKLVSTRPTLDEKWSRCLYMVTAAGSDQQRGYVVWFQPAADFEDMKQYIDEQITPVSGVGDGAYIYRDKGDGRFKLYVLMRGDQTILATGESPESARKVAEAVLGVLRKKAPRAATMPSCSERSPWAGPDTEHSASSGACNGHCARCVPTGVELRSRGESDAVVFRRLVASLPVATR